MNPYSDRFPIRSDFKSYGRRCGIKILSLSIFSTVKLIWFNLPLLLLIKASDISGSGFHFISSTIKVLAFSRYSLFRQSCFLWVSLNLPLRTRILRHTPRTSEGKGLISSQRFLFNVTFEYSAVFGMCLIYSRWQVFHSRRRNGARIERRFSQCYDVIALWMSLRSI